MSACADWDPVPEGVGRLFRFRRLPLLQAIEQAWLVLPQLVRLHPVQPSDQLVDPFLQLGVPLPFRLMRGKQATHQFLQDAHILGKVCDGLGW